MGESTRSYNFIKGEPQWHWGAQDGFPQGLVDIDIASSCGRSARRCSQQYEYERAALQAAKYEGTSNFQPQIQMDESHFHQNFKAFKAADSQYIQSCLAYTIAL